jgi:hypothetical protein
LRIPEDHVVKRCPVCEGEFTTRRAMQQFCSQSCKWYALNARRIDKRGRKTAAEPRVSPEMVRRRAAVIRSQREGAEAVRAVCAYCAKPIPAVVHGKEKRFCGPWCATRARRKARAEAAC